MNPCTSILLIVLLLCFSVQIDGKKPPMRIVCRFDHNGGTRYGFSIDYLDPFLCSHFLFEPPMMYRTTNTDCKQRFSAGFSESNLTQNRAYQALMKLTNTNPKLKVMLSINSDFIKTILFEITACRNSSSKIINDDELIADDAFLEPIKHYKFTGLDIIYRTEIIHSSDIDTYNNVVLKTQQAFKKNGQLFSITLFQNTSQIDIVTRKFNRLLIDFINFQSLNWNIDGKVSHHAPLYENFPNISSPKRRNVNETVHLIKRNHPLSKIVLGISLLGHGWRIPANLKDTHPPVTLLNVYGMRVIYYSEICHAIRTERWQVFYEDVHRNISPYVVSPVNDPERIWTSFEDPHTAIVKSNYILEKGLGGVYISDIDFDDFNNSCGEGRYPLLKAISRTLHF